MWRIVAVYLAATTTTQISSSFNIWNDLIPLVAAAIPVIGLVYTNRYKKTSANLPQPAPQPVPQAAGTEPTGWRQAVDEINDAFDRRRRTVDERFEDTDRRFRSVDSRFGEIDERAARFDGRIGSLERRADQSERADRRAAAAAGEDYEHIQRRADPRPGDPPSSESHDPDLGAS